MRIIYATQRFGTFAQRLGNAEWARRLHVEHIRKCAITALLFVAGPCLASHAIGPVRMAPAVAAPVQIAMYGDSTTVGATYETGIKTISDFNVPAQLGRLLNATGYNVVVSNFGQSGSTSTDLLYGTHGFARPWAQEMAQSTASIVFVNEGMNDATMIAGGSETEAQYRSNLAQLISTALSYGKRVYIEGPNPREDSVPDSYNQVVSRAALAVVNTFQGLPVTWIGHHRHIADGTFPDWQAHLPGGGVHPDDTLYMYKAAFDYSFVIQSLSSP